MNRAVLIAVISCCIAGACGGQQTVQSPVPGTATSVVATGPYSWGAAWTEWRSNLAADSSVFDGGWDTPWVAEVFRSDRQQLQVEVARSVDRCQDCGPFDRYLGVSLSGHNGDDLWFDGDEPVSLAVMDPAIAWAVALDDGSTMVVVAVPAGAAEVILPDGAKLEEAPLVTPPMTEVEGDPPLRVLFAQVEEAPELVVVRTPDGPRSVLVEPSGPS